MPDSCSCGAQLPPDARFCHKCGKPQFEEPSRGEVEAGEEAGPPAAVPPPPAESADISFRNRTAVRAGLWAALAASLLTLLPMPPVAQIVWMPLCLAGAGFLSVYLYRRRTGAELTAGRGARMGWMTGIFCFAIATVFFTITIILLSVRDGLAAFYREQIAEQTAGQANAEEFLRLLESPSGLAAILFFSLLLLFLFSTLLATLGGAMGAKVLEKD